MTYFFLLGKIILETEKAQNKSPSRLDSFVKTLEADRDYYKSEAQNLRKMIRSRSKSPRRPSPSSRVGFRNFCVLEFIF